MILIHQVYLTFIFRWRIRMFYSWDSIYSKIWFLQRLMTNQMGINRNQCDSKFIFYEHRIIATITAISPFWTFDSKTIIWSDRSQIVYCQLMFYLLLQGHSLQGTLKKVHNKDQIDIFNHTTFFYTPLNINK